MNHLVKHPQELGKRTWLSVLAEVRTEEYVDGKDGAKVTVGGEGTSKVYIIEKNGKKQFFKESEKLPPENLIELYLREIGRLKVDNDEYAADDDHSQQEKDEYRLAVIRKQNLILNVCRALMMVKGSREEADCNCGKQQE